MSPTYVDFRAGAFVGCGPVTSKQIWKDAGFNFCPDRRLWVADNLDIATKAAGVQWSVRAAEQAAKQRELREQAFEMSFRGSTDFVVPIPQALKDKGWEFKPFQRAGVEYALQRDDALVGDQPGLGKTVQAIGVANCDPAIRRVLVICPASLKEMWRRHWVEWSTEGLTAGIAEASIAERVPDGFYKNGKPRFRKVVHKDVWPDTDVVIVNYDILDRFPAQINGRRWDMLVADECHALKSDESQRTMLVLGGHKRAKGRGAQRTEEVWYRPIEARRRVFLSGTPMLNRPKEFWPIVKAFDPKGLGRSKEAFAYRYCEAYTEGGRFPRLMWDGAANLDELGEKLRQSFMVRRLKRDVLPELPPKTRIVVPLDSQEIRDIVAREDELAQSLRLYEHIVQLNGDPLGAIDMERLQGDMIVDRLTSLGLGGGRLGASGDGDLVKPSWRNLEMDYAKAVLGLEPPAVAIGFEEIATVRRELGIAKVPAVLEWARNFLDAAEKLILFAYHTEVVEALIEGLRDYSPAYVYGKVPSSKRQGQIDRFQEDERCRVAIGNIHAMGVGYTMVRAHDVAFAEGDWTPTMMEQSEDRVCRIGQLANKIMSYYLVANGSLDARIAQSSKAKEDNIIATIG